MHRECPRSVHDVDELVRVVMRTQRLPRCVRDERVHVQFIRCAQQGGVECVPSLGVRALRDASQFLVCESGLRAAPTRCAQRYSDRVSHAVRRISSAVVEVGAPNRLRRSARTAGCVPPAMDGSDTLPPHWVFRTRRIAQRVPAVRRSADSPALVPLEDRRRAMESGRRGPLPRRATHNRLSSLLL